MSNEKKLSGQTAIVTGANSGIGEGVAMALGGAGANVVVNYVSHPEAAEAVAEKPAQQPSTVLVYKDGHQTEVVNYAIVGETLYELSDGRAKKVALAELDLSATEKQNDERSVDFRVPPTTNMKSN